MLLNTFISICAPTLQGIRLSLRWNHLLFLLFIPVSTAFSAPLPRSAQWPLIPLPANLQTTPLAEELIVNGLPMQITAFTSRHSVPELLSAFKKIWGTPLMENHIGDKTILGRAQGRNNEYYLSVELEAHATGTRGTLSQTNIKTAHENQAQTQQQHQRWINRLPAASQITSDIVSKDAGILSKHLIISNQHSLDINKDYIKRLLAQDGFALEKESQPSLKHSAITLFFKGQNKEAMATLSKNASAQTIIVLNTTQQLDTFR